MTALKLYPWERTQLWLSDGCYVRLKELFSRKCNSLRTSQQFKSILVTVSLHLPSEISHTEKEEIQAQRKNNVQHKLYGVRKCTESWMEGHIKMTPASLFPCPDVFCFEFGTQRHWKKEYFYRAKICDAAQLHTFCWHPAISLILNRSLFPHKAKSACSFCLAWRHSSYILPNQSSQNETLKVITNFFFENRKVHSTLFSLCEEDKNYVFYCNY